MAMKVTKEENKNQVAYKSPYHPALPLRAKRLGGKWVTEKKVWTFDKRDEKAVDALYDEIYGEHGTEAGELVTVVATYQKETNGYESDMAIYIAGRQVARAFDRDCGAKLGEGVILRRGSFGSGGSRKNPALVWSNDTIVEIRDVPKKVAEISVDGWTMTILEKVTIDKEALLKEKAQLLVRMAEIDKLLVGGA
jgi:hypothetical protein